MLSTEELGLDEVLYTVPESIRIARTSRTAFYGAVKEGKVRLTKNGRRSFCLAIDLAAFISQLRDGK